MITPDEAVREATLLFEQSAVEAELAGMLGAPVTKPLRFDLGFNLCAASPFSRALRDIVNT